MKSTEPKSPSTAARAKEANGNAFFSKGKGETLASENEQVQAFFAEPKHETPFFDAVQPKLKVHPSNDSYEKEADATAERVVQGLHQTPAVQRKEGEVDEGLQTKSIADTLTPVQTKRAFDSPSPLELGSSDAENDQPVQRKGAGEPESASSALESQLQSSKGQGSPLPAQTRSSMESGFGADFSGVRAHTGSDAVQMNQQLGARAFTHGNDVYFNQGEFQPGTDEGDRLLAHELTHTVQQGKSLQRKAIQKTAPASAVPAPSSSVATLENGKYEFDPVAKRLTIPEMLIPEFKVNRYPSQYPSPLEFPLRARPATNQIESWKTLVRPSVQSKLLPKFPQPESNIYYFKTISSDGPAIFGSKEQILEESIIPRWDRTGNTSLYQVDHIREMQLGGQDDPSGSNYELLDRAANASSGSKIDKEKDKKIDAALGKFKAANIPGVPDSAAAMTNDGTYTIKVTKLSDKLPIRGQTENYWKLSEIINGDHLAKIRPMTQSEIGEISGSANELMIFLAGRTSTPRKLKLVGGNGNATVDKPDWFPGFHLKQINVNTSDPEGVSGTIAGDIKSRRGSPIEANGGPVPIPIEKIPGLRYAGLANRTGLPAALQSRLRFKALSPIEFSQVDFSDTQGLLAIGKVLPTVPLIRNADIELVIEGESIRLRKLFTINDFKLPAPFEVTDCSIEIFYEVGSGFGAEGRLGFQVPNLGRGLVTAGISNADGFSITGAFSFDTTIFDPAEINVQYQNSVLTVGGRIGIPPRKVKGIRRASVEMSYSSGNFTANGNVDLEVPGIQSAAVGVAYQNGQLTITGSAQLADNIPGLQGGSVTARVSKSPAGEWKLAINGTVIPRIPGVNSSLSVSYDDGALTIHGSAAYDRGLLSGSIELGATNRAIGDDGLPSGDPVDRFSVYGGGSLTLRITPWLAATAGVRFLPNGEIEVRGRIGLPAAVNVFDERKIERSLFSMPQIEIPIFAIPLGPKSIGLVATINGGLDFSAGFGPGQIQQLYGEVVYNPAHPEQTTLSGSGRFVIPANAGLKLHADLGLGLSVGFASLTGGIEIAGSLGLSGEAAASVDVNWSPATGLELNALGEINVQPKFTFDVNLIARASLSLPWPLPDLSKSWRHNLYSFQWGPDIQFGISFPVHYKEGQPFDISTDQIQVKYPDINIGDIATGLAREIKDRVF